MQPRSRDQQRHAAAEARRARQQAAANRAKELLAAFRLPSRETDPDTVVAHLGPTNSGKSHDALAALLAAGAGAYAAPLRLLAREAWDKLRRLAPEARIGLVTGEERIDPGAPIVACTTELAPMRGEVLVLDEVHWVDDPDRGWAWGRLLAGASYRHIRLVGAANAEPVLRAAYGEQLEVRRHRRLVDLQWGGAVEPATVPAGALVVAFSRKAVLALARTIGEAAGLRTGVLYGALPPGARVGQIERFLAGDLDVLCVTDVIGHGINLPARSVVMAETSKYDGERRRPLHLWELAQIVGRAGRFGLAEEGWVHVLRGFAGLEPNASSVRQAVDVAGGQRAAGPGISTAPIRPTLDDLGAVTATELFDAVEAWQAASATALGGHPWLRAAPLDRLWSVLASLRRAGVADGLDAATLWRLATSPVEDEALLVELAGRLAGGSRPLAPPALPEGRSLSLEEAERLAGRARGLAALGRAFPALAAEEPDRLLEVEAAAARRILDVLPASVAAAPHGRCGSCGRPCPPWSERCDRCAGRRPVPPRRPGGRGPRRR